MSSYIIEFSFYKLDSKKYQGLKYWVIPPQPLALTDNTNLSLLPKKTKKQNKLLIGPEAKRQVVYNRTQGPPLGKPPDPPSTQPYMQSQGTAITSGTCYRVKTKFNNS